jgi:hypothetical protein
VWWAIALVAGCAPGTSETQSRLLGRWSDGTATAEFGDDGSVYVENRTYELTVGQRLKYTVRPGGADLQDGGAATL